MTQYKPPKQYCHTSLYIFDKMVFDSLIEELNKQNISFSKAVAPIIEQMYVLVQELNRTKRKLYKTRIRLVAEDIL